MPRIEVRRLRYRGEASQAGRVEHAIGDALRTETTDDGRLILVRRLPLGRIGFGERGASHAAAKAWRDLVGSARHGGESGAEAANCVWFASPAEARALILRELARGRTPFAWFWALAVPDWRRLTLAQYLDHRLGLALAEPSGEAIAALVEEALAAGAVEALAAAILAKVPTGAPLPPMPVERSPPGANPERGTADTGSAPADAAHEAERALALGVLRAVPPLLRAVLERLAAASSAATMIETLARGLVRRLHPALALAPGRLARVASGVIELLRTGQSELAGPGGVSAERSTAVDPALTSEANSEAPPQGRSPGEDSASPAGLAEPATPLPAPPDRIAETEPEPAAGHRELASTAAGLFLAVEPLIRLGWRDWLAARPDWLLHQPGARLLRAIARHHPVPPGDSIWALLPHVDPESEPPAALEAALALWRKGLDGWLRRRARLNLAELVLRRGWLLAGPDTTIVRFPLDAIDIRLRRLALDSDPGWVDWLGHSYRLVYRDRPLTGPQAP